MLSEPTSPKLLIDAIRKVMDEAQRLKNSIGRSKQFIPSPPISMESIPPLHLPFPHDILSSIDSLGLPEFHSLQLKRRLSEQIHGSQKIILQAYKQTCRDVSNTPHAPNKLERLRDAYEVAYHKQHLNWLKHQILTWQIKLKTHQRVIQKRRPTFNTGYTPFLEKYFEYNAYPSAADRLVLSQKSMMTPRQIEVWFQNHRNRAKREGKPLARLSSGLPLRISLDSLQEKMTNSEEEIEENCSDEDSGDDIRPFKSQIPLPDSSIEAFTDLRPPHAFPAPFPSNSTDYPFPNDNGIFKFEPPLWRRRPSTNRSPLPAVNMDEFVVLFASKLSLRKDSTAGKGRSTTPASLRPWFTATVTILPPAPHPALVRPTCLRPVSPSTTIPTLALNHTFPPSSRFATPVVSPSCTRVSKVLKPLPLPRRTPPNTSQLFNGAPSPSTSRSSSGRASSVTSATTQSRSSSSSSSSPSMADPPTPTFTPAIQKQRLDFPVEALSDYLNILSQQQSYVSNKRIPPIAQYRINPPQYIPQANYFEAQS